MSLPLGSRVGIYEVVELIGVGGMGEVYRAGTRASIAPWRSRRCPTNSRRIRIGSRDSSAKRRCSRNSITRTSPASTGSNQGTPVALAMEMAEGETLGHRILSGPLPIEDAIIIARQVAEALEARARQEHRPSRSQASEHQDRCARQRSARQGARLRSRESDVDRCGIERRAPAVVTNDHLPGESHTRRRRARHRRVHGARAGARPQRRSSRRHLGIRMRAVRDADGPARVRRRRGRRRSRARHPIRSGLVAPARIDAARTAHAAAAMPSQGRASARPLDRRCADRARGACTPARHRSSSRSQRRHDDRAWWPALAGLAIGAAVASAIFLWLTSRQSAPPPQKVLRFTVSAPAGLRLSRAPGNGRLLMALSPDGEKLAAVMVGKDGMRRIFVRRFPGQHVSRVAGHRRCHRLLLGT